MEIVSLSIGRNILIPQSRDRLRMALYARELEGLHIIVLTRKGSGYTEVEHEGTLHVYPTNSRTRSGMLIDAFCIAYRILKSRKQVTTISSQDPLELGLLALFLSKVTGVPYGVQVHGDYMSEAWTEGSCIRRMRRHLMPLVLRHATRIRVVSERIKKSLVRFGVPLSKMVVLPIRPELETFLSASTIGTKHESFTVLTASRLAPEKNIPFLIRAFKKLHERHNDARLRIAGEGSERVHIEHTIKELNLSDAVTLLPWVKDIEKEMARAHVFALASLHEAYGLVLIEALASGTPVVTTDVGCVGEVVVHGEHGIVVSKYDEQEYGEALIQMYEDTEKREKMGNAGIHCGIALSSLTESEYAKQWVVAHSAE